MTVIDVHTHMLTLDWIELLRTRGGGQYKVKKTRAGQESIWKDGETLMEQSHWLPLRQRSWANGVISAAALIGIASTFHLFGGLIDSVGWQAAFVVSATVTALVAAVWTIYARNMPDEHRGVNQAERDLIEGNRSIDVGAPSS